MKHGDMETPLLSQEGCRAQRGGVVPAGDRPRLRLSAALLYLFVPLWFCVFSLPAFAADKWLSINTKNFLLVGNASESEIRRVGRTLEEFRSAVATIFPKMGQTSSVPTTIL